MRKWPNYAVITFKNMRISFCMAELWPIYLRVAELLSISHGIVAMASRFTALQSRHPGAREMRNQQVPLPLFPTRKE